MGVLEKVRTAESMNLVRLLTTRPFRFKRSRVCLSPELSVRKVDDLHVYLAVAQRRCRGVSAQPMS